MPWVFGHTTPLITILMLMLMLAWPVVVLMNREGEVGLAELILVGWATGGGGSRR